MNETLPPTSSPQPASPEPTPAILPVAEPNKKKKRYGLWLLLLALIVLAPLGYLAYQKWAPRSQPAITETPGDGSDQEATPAEDAGALRLDLTCSPSGKYAAVPYRIDCKTKIVGKGSEEAKSYLTSHNSQLKVAVEGISTAFPTFDGEGRGGAYLLTLATSHFANSLGRFAQYLPPATKTTNIPSKAGAAQFSYIYAGGAAGGDIRFRAIATTADGDIEGDATVKLVSPGQSQIAKGSFYYDVTTNKTSLSKGKVFDLKIDITARDSKTQEVYDNPYQEVYVVFSPSSSKLVSFDKSCMGSVSPQSTYEFHYPITWDVPESHSGNRADCSPSMKLQGYTYYEYPYPYFPVALIKGHGTLTVSFEGDQEFDDPSLSFVVVPGDYISLMGSCADSASSKDCAQRPAPPRKPTNTTFLYGTWMTDDSLSYKVFTRVVLPVK